MERMEVRELIERVVAGKKAEQILSEEYFVAKLKKSEILADAICILDGAAFMEDYIGHIKDKEVRIPYSEIVSACIPWYLAEKKERTKAFIVTKDNFRYELKFSTNENAQCFVEIVDSFVRTERDLKDDQGELDYYYICIRKLSSGICKIGAMEKVRKLSDHNSVLCVPDDFSQLLSYRDTFQGYWYFRENFERMEKEGLLGFTEKILDWGGKKQFEQIEGLYDKAIQKIMNAEEHNVYEAYINHIGFFLILCECATKNQIEIEDAKIRDFKVFSDKLYEKLCNNTLDYKYATVFPNEYSMGDNEVFRLGWVLGTAFYNDSQIKDDRKAIQWFEYALSGKNAVNEPKYSDIMYYYAMCMKVQGIGYDEERFVQYLKEAAKGGNYLAEYELALFYKKKNDVEGSLEWEKRAEEHGIKDEQKYKRLMKKKALENSNQIISKAIDLLKTTAEVAGAVSTIVVGTFKVVETVKKL